MGDSSCGLIRGKFWFKSKLSISLKFFETERCSGLWNYNILIEVCALLFKASSMSMIEPVFRRTSRICLNPDYTLVSNCRNSTSTSSIKKMSNFTFSWTSCRSGIERYNRMKYRVTAKLYTKKIPLSLIVYVMLWCSLWIYLVRSYHIYTNGLIQLETRTLDRLLRRLKNTIMKMTTGL